MQGFNGELGFNDDYNQRSRGVVCVDEYSYLVKQQSHASSFFTTCILYKIDTLENIEFAQPIAPEFAEYRNVFSMIPSENGGVYVLSFGLPTCDVMGDCFWALQKFDGAGVVTWTKLFPDPSCFVSNVTGLTMDQNNFLNINFSDETESILYEIDFNGNLIDSLFISRNELEQVNSSTAFEKIAFKEDSLLGFDNNGLITDYITFSSPIQNYLVISDTIFLLTGDSIFSFNSTFGQITGAAFPGYSSLSLLKNVNNTLQCVNNGISSQDILTFNHQLQLSDVQTIPVALDATVPKDFNHLHFSSAESFALTEFYAIRHLDYSLLSAVDENTHWTDIGIEDFDVITTTFASGWPGVYTYQFNVYALVHNYGSTVLNSCRINRIVGTSVACGYYAYCEEFTGLTIAPGENAWILIGLLPDEHGYFTGDTLMKNVCFYTSHPNGKTDPFVANDADCQDIILGYAGIEDHHQYEKELVKIVDVTGREIKYQSNTVMIFVYSDGTTEKVFRFE